MLAVLTLLEHLRRYWQDYRPRTWLFPGQRYSEPLVNGGVKARDSGVLGFDRKCFQNRSLRDAYERQAFIKLILPLRWMPSGRRVGRAQVLLRRCGERSARCPGLPSPSPLS